MIQCLLVRRIPEEHVRETLVRGREIPSDEPAFNGGFISKFYKDFVVRTDKYVVTKSLVAEIVGNKCIFLTAYHTRHG